ncbi:MAG: tRNA epoxyqueuosine(34) reductase QueG [Ignavibacteria bacterium GWF2_33_9]|nr:MAG: tRNA epoxyqueuosine(34) reductase QueG [Ignavibacteria bacterium GWF2_33_9]
MNLDKLIIQQKAKELGISEIKFTTPFVDVQTIQNYEIWLNKGFAAEMEYLKNNFEKRANPLNLMPEVKSVIVCALNYFPGKHQELQKGYGKISKYAQGEDYHDVFKNILKELTGWIKTIEPNFEYYISVDSSAVFEKYFAEKSGIGWQGKNGIIINPEIGSFIFLGVVFSNIEFEADSTLPDLCGTCVKCLEQCPTQAIIQPKVIDANKCISYWTIESKAAKIPVEISEKNTEWLYGCDVCQDVCPWNEKNAKITKIRSFLNPENFALELETLMQMEQEEFSRKFAKSAIKRAKLTGLKRNAEGLVKS